MAEGPYEPELTLYTLPGIHGSDELATRRVADGSSICAALALRGVIQGLGRYNVAAFLNAKTARMVAADLLAAAEAWERRT